MPPFSCTTCRATGSGSTFAKKPAMCPHRTPTFTCGVEIWAPQLGRKRGALASTYRPLFPWPTVTSMKGWETRGRPELVPGIGLPRRHKWSRRVSPMRMAIPIAAAQQDQATR